MPFEPFTYDDHETTFERLFHELRGSFTYDERAFFRSFEEGDPDWGRFPIVVFAEMLAPQFKLMNFRNFREASPARHRVMLDALEESINRMIHSGARGGRIQPVPSSTMPQPGTIMWRCEWCVSAESHV